MAYIIQTLLRYSALRESDFRMEARLESGEGKMTPMIMVTHLTPRSEPLGYEPDMPLLSVKHLLTEWVSLAQEAPICSLISPVHLTEHAAMAIGSLGPSPYVRRLGRNRDFLAIMPMISIKSDDGPLRYYRQTPKAFFLNFFKKCITSGRHGWVNPLLMLSSTESFQSIKKTVRESAILDGTNFDDVDGWYDKYRDILNRYNQPGTPASRVFETPIWYDVGGPSEPSEPLPVAPSDGRDLSW